MEIFPNLSPGFANLFISQVLSRYLNVEHSLSSAATIVLHIYPLILTSVGFGSGT